ncbi:hypothetical protein [Streptomyces sp. NPDC054887]
MNAIQQHMIDVHRAARLATPPPPAPGRHDWQAVREVREYRRFRAVAEGRPPRTRRLRAALAHLLAAARIRPAHRPRPVAARTPRPCG